MKQRTMALSETEKDLHDNSQHTKSTAQDTLLSEDGQTEKDTENEEFEEDENMGVPTDRGYSWVIVACAFVNGFLIMGHNRALSALFVDISQEFSTSTTTTALTFTFYTLVSCVSTVVTGNILLGRIQARKICVVAATFNGLLTVLISTSPNIYVWLALYGVKGISFGTLLVPATTVVGFYFKKKRNLACAIASTGIVAAYIVFPPLASFLRVQYGLRGAMLIIGAIEWNNVASSMLLRPFGIYKRAYLRRRGLALQKMNSNRSNDQDKTFVEHQKSFPFPARQTSVISSNSEIEPTTPLQDSTKSNIGRQKSLTGSPPDYDEHLEGDHLSDVNKVTTKTRTISVNSERMLTGSIAGSLLDMVLVGPGFVNENSVNKQVDDNSSEEDDTMKPLACKCSTFIDLSLVKLWIFRMVFCYMGLSAFVNFILLYMPAIAYQSGVSKTDAAFLLTIAGCTDLTVRIAVGFIADKSWFSKEYVICGSLSVIVVICQFARYYTTYSLFVMFSLLIGIFSGFRQNFFNALLLDYFGPLKAPRALGLIAMNISLTISINHPVLGAMVDATGSFNASLHYVGAGVTVSIIILMCRPIFQRWDEENKKKAKETARDEENDLTIESPN